MAIDDKINAPVVTNEKIVLPGLDEDAVLRTVLEGTATETGERFFTALVQSLASALDTHAAMVTEYHDDLRELHALAFWAGEDWVNEYRYDVAGTPCEAVVDEGSFFHHPKDVQSMFSEDSDLVDMDAVSYMGVPLTDLDGKVLGTLAVIDTKPMPGEPKGLALFHIFAARAAAELQRMRRESEVKEREEKLGRLVDSAMDAIIELDKDLNVTMMNAAAEKVFACPAADVIGEEFGRRLSEDSDAKLAELVRDLDAMPEDRRHLWIPGGLTAARADGTTFPAEATLARFEMDRHAFYTLILRNVDERLEAENKIRSLTVEAEYLREQIRSIVGFDEIIGQSEALLELLREVEQVADTATTVLIFGETGTGKELIARAIHAASPRQHKTLIKVNCAAIPAALIESELFGHEEGAFTGATKKRDGRFALADGGTIFLDEVGEIPIELQSKLLRVLQEGEFEPVGSSKTRNVDVRVLAATNRDLQRSIREGDFREDLYYRLNVFPLTVPPLRDRKEDIPVLAAAFTEKFAKRMGRAIAPLSNECVRRLKAYQWPGNVRELENVVERALITSRDGSLNLDRALPETGEVDASFQEVASEVQADAPVRTVHELQTLERDNILRALKACTWRVAGENGAAALLGMNPSTLSSRMKTLGIRRPR